MVSKVVIAILLMGNSSTQLILGKVEKCAVDSLITIIDQCFTY